VCITNEACHAATKTGCLLFQTAHTALFPPPPSFARNSRLKPSSIVRRYNRLRIRTALNVYLQSLLPKFFAKLKASKSDRFQSFIKCRMKTRASPHAMRNPAPVKNRVRSYWAFEAGGKLQRYSNQRGQYSVRRHRQRGLQGSPRTLNAFDKEGLCCARFVWSQRLRPKEDK